MTAAKYPRRAIALGKPFDDGTYWTPDGKQDQLPAAKEIGAKFVARVMAENAIAVQPIHARMEQLDSKGYRIGYRALNGGRRPAADFDGETYEPIRDRERLTRQLDKVREWMLFGDWQTLPSIAKWVGAPEASVSARLRDLRKAKFGGYLVQRQYAGDGLWEYRLVRPPVEQGRLGL